MAESDIAEIYEIEQQSFMTPWTLDSLQRELSNTAARYLALIEDGHVVAYAGMWLVLDEGHVMNIAVRPDRRGQGYGERITHALIQLAADTGLSFITLEVRRGNDAARSLYKKLGFIEVGLRKGYYSDSGEDAVLMGLDKLPKGNPDNDPFLIREGD